MQLVDLADVEMEDPRFVVVEPDDGVIVGHVNPSQYCVVFQ